MADLTTTTPCTCNCEHNDHVREVCNVVVTNLRPGNICTPCANVLLLASLQRTREVTRAA